MQAIEHIEVSDTQRIAIYHDNDFMLFDDHDVGASALVNYGTRNGSREYGNSIELPELTREQIKQNAKDICNLLERKTLLEVCEYRATGDCTVDLINQALADSYEYTSENERIEFLAYMLDIAGIQNHASTGRGYSQGDYYDILIVLDKPNEFPKPAEALAAIAEEFECCTFGDVYGYVVEAKCPTCGSWDDTDNSCWGFIGKRDSEGWNYMVEQAKLAAA